MTDRRSKRRARSGFDFKGHTEEIGLKSINLVCERLDALFPEEDGGGSSRSSSSQPRPRTRAPQEQDGNSASAASLVFG
jgi:hypothetical protein